jgi:hypothetical protein
VPPLLVEPSNGVVEQVSQCPWFERRTLLDLLGTLLGRRIHRHLHPVATHFSRRHSALASYPTWAQMPPRPARQRCRTVHVWIGRFGQAFREVGGARRKDLQPLRQCEFRQTRLRIPIFDDHTIKLRCA